MINQKIYESIEFIVTRWWHRVRFRSLLDALNGFNENMVFDTPINKKSKKLKQRKLKIPTNIPTFVIVGEFLLEGWTNRLFIVSEVSNVIEI